MPKITWGSRPKAKKCDFSFSTCGWMDGCYSFFHRRIFPYHSTDWNDIETLPLEQNEALISPSPYWASQSRLTCLRMNRFPLWQNPHQGKLASYSGPDDFSRPWSLSSSTRPKSPSWLGSVERGLQAFSCHPGCNSEASYQINDDLILTATHDLPAHRVFLPFLFYRYYHCMWSDELQSVTPTPPPPKPAITRFANSQHP